MFGFLAGLVAGAAAPLFTRFIARPVSESIGRWVEVKDEELPVIGFMITMLIAGLVAQALQSGTVFWVIFGGVIGFFALRILSVAAKLFERRPKKFRSWNT